MTGAATVRMCLALSDPVLCCSVQPEQGDKVDVLYKVQGRNAYFRGTVLRVVAGTRPLVSVRFGRQTHYGVLFQQETTDIRWIRGVVRVVV